MSEDDYDGNDDDNQDDNQEGDNNSPATDREIARLIRTQARRIKELESESQGNADLKAEVETLQATLGTRSSLGELVDQLKALNAAGSQLKTPQEKALSDLTVAAEANDMKTYRRLRQKEG